MVVLLVLNKEFEMKSIAVNTFDFDGLDVEIMQKRVYAHYIYSINETVMSCYSPRLGIGYVRVETSRYTKIYRYQAKNWEEFKKAIRLYPL